MNEEKYCDKLKDIDDRHLLLEFENFTENNKPNTFDEYFDWFMKWYFKPSERVDMKSTIKEYKELRQRLRKILFHKTEYVLGLFASQDENTGQYSSTVIARQMVPKWEEMSKTVEKMRYNT